MPNIHQLNCATNKKNTGYGGCPLDWKLISGAFIFDQPTTFSASFLADLQNQLQLMAWQDNKAGRLFPIGKFVNPTDATGEPTIQTFADGSKAKVRDDVYDWTFDFTAGGFCLLQAIRTHSSNGNSYALFYDKQNKILGTQGSGTYGSLSTIPLQILDAAPWKMNTGSAVAKYSVHFVFDAASANENSEYVQAGFDLGTIVGLQDIRIIHNGFNHNTGMVNVSLVTECGGSNLYTSYSSNIVASMISAINAQNGGSIAVISVSPIPSTQSFNILLNPADPNFPTSGVINLSMAAPSVLSAHNLVGYEAETLALAVLGS